jgi:hypothetical protein
MAYAIRKNKLYKPIELPHKKPCTAKPGIQYVTILYTGVANACRIWDMRQKYTIPGRGVVCF